MSHSCGAARAQRGFTLLELLVASALLAVLAVIGWRGLETVLSARDRIVERSGDLRAMTVAFSQMDEDLRRSWPVERLELLPPPMQALAFRATSGSMTVELVREGGGASDPSRIERVAYRLRDGLLERGFGPLLAGTVVQDAGSSLSDGAASAGLATGGAAGAGSAGGLPLSNAPLIWQPLLRDVAAVQYRAWVAQRGWSDAATIAAAQAVQAMQLQQLRQAQQAQQAAAAQAGNPALEAARQAARSAEAGLRIAGVEVTVVRSNGDRYLRVFARED